MGMVAAAQRMYPSSPSHTKLLFLKILLLKKFSWGLHDSENGKWCRTQKAGAIGKTVTHTHTHTKGRFHIQKTSMIQNFRKNLNLPSQVSFCSPCLITWPLPHSMTSDSSHLPPALPHTFSIVPAFTFAQDMHFLADVAASLSLSHVCIRLTSHSASQFLHANSSTWLSPHSYCCNLLIWLSLVVQLPQQGSEAELSIYMEMGRTEKEAYKRSNCWEVSESTCNWLGRRE